MINQLVQMSDGRYRTSRCWQCSYKKNCPRDCGRCLHYIHTPSAAPAPRKYDCGKMCDYYVCKYSHKYMSELYYAFYNLTDLRTLDDLKVLSIGCGPCTDLLAFERLRKEGIYNFKSLEYRGIEIDTRIWKRIYCDIKQIAPANYDIQIIDEDACDYVDRLYDDEWRPNVIVFQYVFSDMQKHSDEDKIQHLLSAMSNFISHSCDINTYVVCNDINLSRAYNGGREFFDILCQKITCPKIISKRHFYNNNKRSHFEYGNEYRHNELVCSIPDYIWDYDPYTSCASAQLIIKKVIENDNKCK